MHDYKVYCYFNSHSQTFNYPLHTKRELYAKIVRNMRRWIETIGTVLVIEDNNLIWELRNSPNDGIYFRNLEAHYGKSYITKIHDV